MTLTVVLILGLAFLFTTVMPYKPRNPMRPDRPVVSQLMSFDSSNGQVVQFMKDNGIGGRILPTWTLSNYLLFHVPGIKVYMDCRDQSAYSDSVIRQYFSVLNVSGQTAGQALEILDRGRVEFVILATNPRDFQAATILMATRRWGCIYKDDEAFVLARTDSERLGPMIRSGRLDGLTYARPENRVISTVILRKFMGEPIPEELLASLKRIVANKPDRNLYSLVTSVMNGQRGCLNAACRDYLTSEANRLSALDYMVANGAKTIVESLVLIYTLLDINDEVCNSGPLPANTSDSESDGKPR